MKSKEYGRSANSGRIRNKYSSGSSMPRNGRKSIKPDLYATGKSTMKYEEGERKGNKRLTQGRNKRDRNDYKSDKPEKRISGKHPGNSSYSLKKNQVTSRKTTAADNEGMRLNRYLAHSGICSRRQADEFIKAGLVSVNGVIVKEMGIKVRPDDVVKYNGETIRSEKKVYILLNKPKDYVTSLEDEKGRKTVTDLIKGACRERVYPVGRLDRNTTGVMLLTNDGELSAKLTHPKYNKKKIYHVILDKKLRFEDLQTVANGITLEDGPIIPDSITYIEGGKRNEIGIEIHSGRNRIVKRIFEHLGYRVIKLDRVYFAGLTKKSLPRGKWRLLTEKEIVMLKMNAYV